MTFFDLESVFVTISIIYVFMVFNSNCNSLTLTKNDLSAIKDDFSFMDGKDLETVRSLFYHMAMMILSAVYIAVSIVLIALFK